MSNVQLNANKLIEVLQRKIGELTSVNVIQEVQISSLQDSNAELVKQLADLSTHVQEEPKTTFINVGNSVCPEDFPVAAQ